MICADRERNVNEQEASFASIELSLAGASSRDDRHRRRAPN